MQYSDGDREDMDREELQYAMDFYIQQQYNNKKGRHVQSDSDEDESYRPSPKVTLSNSFINVFLWISLHVLLFTPKQKVTFKRKGHGKGNQDKQPDNDTSSTAEEDNIAKVPFTSICYTLSLNEGVSFLLLQKKVRATQKRIEKGTLSLPQCIDLTGPKSVAS